MQTILRSKSQEVIIDTEGPVLIIGESINPTRIVPMGPTINFTAPHHRNTPLADAAE